MRDIGCAFCADLHRAQAVQQRLGLERFESLRAHFDEREIVEITWLSAIGNYFNLLAIPLGLESDDLISLALQRAG